uniref:Uncharacterized protein n=1 Tax=Micrurus corallinus TaxID=54390 RepID=A0A2D4FPK1_MICCO
MLLIEELGQVVTQAQLHLQPSQRAVKANTPDLQLRLDPRVLGLQSLVGCNGADGTACPHVVEHDVLSCGIDVFPPEDAIVQRHSGVIIDELQNLKVGHFGCMQNGSPLCLVEVCRDGDDCVFDWLLCKVLSQYPRIIQDHTQHLFWRILQLV